MRRPNVLALLLLTPLLAAWSGGGSGDGVWTNGRTTLSVGLSGLVDAEADVRFALNGTLPSGEAMIFVTVPAMMLDRTFAARDQVVEVAYREYGPDGAIVFAADVPESGEVRVERRPGGARVTLSATWFDARARGGTHRQWSDVRVVVAGRDAGGSASHGGEVSGGCDTTVSPDPYYDDDPYYEDPYYDDSSGCEGDDWESDSSSSYDSDGGGCEGDDLSSGDSSSGGCEGDDVGGGSSSCEGDAIASTGARRRSPTIVRLINHFPWLMVIIGLPLVRRRRRA